MKRQKMLTWLSMGAVIVIGLMTTWSSTVSADSLAQATVTAGCVDATAQTASWNVANNGPGTADITWSTNAATSGVYTAPFGNSKFTTPDTGATGNMTVSVAGQPAIDLAWPTEECVTPTVPCVDGTVRSNLEFTWSEETGIVTVNTVNGALLCDDVTVYLSTYTLPAGYDESGIFNDSSLPQQHYASKSTVLQKGTLGAATLQVGVPNACTNFQMDLYYAPEIVDVPYAGHGAQLIYGNIKVRTATDCSVPSTAPGVGGGSANGGTTPPATPPATGPPLVAPGAVLAASAIAPPVTTTNSTHVDAAATQLANTGTSLTLPFIGAILILLSTSYVGFVAPSKNS